MPTNWKTEDQARAMFCHRTIGAVPENFTDNCKGSRCMAWVWRRSDAAIVSIDALPLSNAVKLGLRRAGIATANALRKGVTCQNDLLKIDGVGPSIAARVWEVITDDEKKNDEANKTGRCGAIAYSDADD